MEDPNDTLEEQGVAPEGSTDPGAPQTGGGDNKDERLYAGKYKTLEDLEKAYSEAQAAMTRAQQEAADLRRAQEEQGYNGQQYNPPQPDNDPIAQFNDQFFDNPYQAGMQMVGQALGAFQQSQANVRRESRKFKEDPLYNQIADEFESELSAVPFHQLADPTQAKQAAEFIYNQVAGRYARNMVGNIRQNPAERVNYLKNIGVEEPTSDGDSRDTVDPEAYALLNQLGIRDTQVQAEILRRTRGGRD